MSIMDDLLGKQTEMATLASRIAAETDTSKIQQMAASLQSQGDELRKMALIIEQQNPVSQPPQPPPDPAVMEANKRAEEEMRAIATQVLAEIEKASPAGAEAVAKLRADASFMSGLVGPK